MKTPSPAPSTSLQARSSSWGSAGAPARDEPGSSVPPGGCHGHSRRGLRGLIKKHFPPRPPDRAAQLSKVCRSILGSFICWINTPQPSRRGAGAGLPIPGGPCPPELPSDPGVHPVRAGMSVAEADMELFRFVIPGLIARRGCLCFNQQPSTHQRTPWLSALGRQIPSHNRKAVQKHKAKGQFKTSTKVEVELWTVSSFAWLLRTWLSCCWVPTSHARVTSSRHGRWLLEERGLWHSGVLGCLRQCSERHEINACAVCSYLFRSSFESRNYTA